MNLKGQEYKCSVHETQIWHSMSALACILLTTLYSTLIQVGRVTRAQTMNVKNSK
jgi:hypothetical protein